MCTGWNVIVPEDLPHDDLQVVYLLHGLSDNCSNWMRLTSLERYARLYRVAVVMPEVQRSYYADMKYGLAYFNYVSQELPELAHTLFGLPTDREHSLVMGLSMGGYGALKCGLTYPERYAGIASFSGAVDMVKLRQRFPKEANIWRESVAILGEGLELSPENDLYRLAEKAANAPQKPRFFITCGLQDSVNLLPQNHEFRDHMNQLGFDVAYDEWDGDHEWKFWDRSLELAFEHFLVKR